MRLGRLKVREDVVWRANTSERVMQVREELRRLRDPPDEETSA